MYNTETLAMRQSVTGFLKTCITFNLHVKVIKSNMAPGVKRKGSALISINANKPNNDAKL